MKKTVEILLIALMAMSVFACSKPAAQEQPAAAPTAAAGQPKTTAAETAEPISAPATEETDAPVAPTEASTAEPRKNVLVVVFSATGTTLGVAQKIAAIEDADLYEIVPAELYSDADLNWHDSASRTTREQNDKSVRPAIASEAIDLFGYERIYVGYPIWWGEEPRILDTFVESYDFGNAVMIPFCTSASSGIGRSGKNLAENANGGNWLDGKRFSGSVSESDLADWINGLK